MAMSSHKVFHPYWLLHELNHTQVNRNCRISEDKFVDELIPLEYIPSHHYENLDPGVYILRLNGKQNIFHLPYKLTGGEFVSIRRHDNGYYLYNHDRKILPLYRFTGFTSTASHNKLTIDTVNDYLDGIAIFGYDDYCIPRLDVEPPNEINYLPKINSILINTSSDENPALTDTLKITLKYALRSIGIPEYTDWAFIESATCAAHFIIRIGQVLLNGGEEWQEIEYDTGNDNLRTYFSRLDGMKNIDEIKEYTISNCFKRVSDDTIFSGYELFGHVHNGKTGICITYPKNHKDYPDGDLEDFKNMISSNLDKTPIRVNYILDKEQHKIDLLDEYHVKTFWKRTNIDIKCDYPCSISYFYKTIDDFYPEDQELDLV